MIQLMVRRRLGGGRDGQWLGYDEIEDGRPTGRIVMGHFVDDATGKITYLYAGELPENVFDAEIRRTGGVQPIAPDAWKSLVPTFTEPVEADSFQCAPISASSAPSTAAAQEDGHDAALEADLSDATSDDAAAPRAQHPPVVSTRFVLSFDCAYGPQTASVDRFEDVLPMQKLILDRFGALKPRDWKLHEEHVQRFALAWPN